MKSKTMPKTRVVTKSASSMKWNEVTPLSKTLAMVLFIALPFVGFILGMLYQQAMMLP